MEKATRPPLTELQPHSVWVIVIAISGWISLWLGAAVIVIALNIQEARQQLTLDADAYLRLLNERMVSSETILRGFSALFGSVGRTDPDKVSRYVRQVIESNPQIFALEIIEKVPRELLAEFVAEQQRDGKQNFTVRSFSYASDRSWQTLPDKPTYFPIVFMEPMRHGSEDVLGLDVDSVPFLRAAMNEAQMRRAPVASHPFRLVEGNLAYVVFCPISAQADAASAAAPIRHELMVAMVIDAAKLGNPSNLPLSDGVAALIFNKDYAPSDRNGHLLAIAGKVRSPLETALFPAFEHVKPLPTMGEPLVLAVTRQAGWSDLNLGILALLGVFAGLSSMILAAYLRAKRQGRILQIENERQLWQLAHHDMLTGLPNRLLVMDRLEQSLSRMRRQGKHMAVMFLDLDDLKRVNDTYGHDAGDQLLKFVAERLRASVRMEDTVARMSGDEFVILIEDMDKLDALDVMRSKLWRALSEGLHLGGHAFAVRASIGTAIYPQDGDSPEALLKHADRKMYAQKQARKCGVLQE